MCKLTRDEKAQVGIPQHSRNPYQPRSSTRHNTHILPRIQTLPPLAMVLVVQLRNRLPQRPDTSRGTVLSAMSTDIDLLGPLKASLNAVVDFRCALAQVGPFFGVLKEAVLVRLFGGPDNTCGGAGGVETGVGLVALVSAAELSVGAGVDFWGVVSDGRACACGTAKGGIGGVGQASNRGVTIALGRLRERLRVTNRDSGAAEAQLLNFQASFVVFR
jgi:hypothetical protein